jgi:hypothetical protein
MATYVVMEPPATTDDDAVLRAVFVRDGFHFLAFIVPLFWLLWHRLWVEAVLVLAASLALAALGEIWDLPFAASALTLLVSILVGLEGAAWRIEALRRRGWRQADIVEGANPAEAEIRYIAGDDADDRPAPAPQTASAMTMRSNPTQSSRPALGLLGYPARH